MSKRKAPEELGPFLVPWTIFPFDLVVYAGEDRDRLIRWILRRSEPTEEDIAHIHMRGVGRTVMLEGGQTILWVLEADDHATIAHEALHAATFLLDRIGAEKDGEVTAYMVGYLVNSINGGFEKLRGGNR